MTRTAHWQQARTRVATLATATLAAAAATLATTASTACGPGTDESADQLHADQLRAEPVESAQPRTGRAPSQSVPVSMLSEQGTRSVAPAQEFELDEIGFDFGAEDAPVEVIEFSDYGCGYCRRFHTETFPTLMQEFVETGVVRWKYVTYASGMFPNGFPAAYAAECAGEQGLFPQVSRALYERQPDWKGLRDPYAFFESLVVEAGVDREQFRACFQEERPKGRIRSGILSGARLGVRGTPSFMVQGRPLVGAQPASVWRDIFKVAQELPRESEAPAPGTGAAAAR